MPKIKQSRSKLGLPQLDIFSVPDADMDDDDDENDAELEAELMAILSPGSKKSPMAKPKPLPVPQANLDSMVAESLQDIPSDVSSGDEDDPSLLAELQAYTGEKVVDAPVPTASVNRESNGNVLSLLQERLEMYKTAEGNAKLTGDTAKARRLGRGLNILNELLKKAQKGGKIDENDIPLPVTVSTRKPTSDAPPVSENEISKDNDPPPIPPRRSLSKVEPLKEEQSDVDSIVKILIDRRDEYKKAAIAAKKSGDIETAKAHVRVIKQFESVIEAAKEGQPVDLSTMPPSPGVITSNPLPVPQTLPTNAEKQKESPPPTSPEETAVETSTQPTTILEALEQRLAVFQKQAETAKNEGNSSKQRRMGRISKQYEDAIRLHKAGKEIPVDELPTPPGLPPIPVEKKPPPPQATPSLPAKTENKPPPPSPKPQASPSSQPSSSVPQSGRVTRQEKQLALLLKRQREWKEAAIAAKKGGNLVKAKECLRQVKGIDPLIEASRSGLPIDMATIPVAPQDKLSDGFEVVNIKDCLPGTNAEIYDQLKVDLKHQFEMCIETKHHYKALGDVGNANMFEQLAINTKKDLDRVTVLHERDDPVPRFHYQMRNFSIVKANTDLNDNDLQLSIINGINYNVPNPKEIDTYVRYEFPFPSEDPKKEKTSTVYNTNNPEYHTTFIIPILRTNRACQRVFKRHSLKLEVWSKGGFLRSDSLVGTVNVKLQPLETKCTIHDSFDLMDGRKQVGGKLEVKLRLRHPIQAKEVQQVQEKWLIID